MQQRMVLGGFVIILGLLAATNPSVTGAVIGAPDSNLVFFVSLPLVALGAAIIANAIWDVFS